MVDIKSLIFKKETESFNEYQTRKLKAKITIKTLEMQLLGSEIKALNNQLNRFIKQIEITDDAKC